MKESEVSFYRKPQEPILNDADLVLPTIIIVIATLIILSWLLLS